METSCLVSARKITDLDDLSLLTVFAYIPNIREKIRLKRVCRRFYDIASLSLRIHHKWIRKRKDVYYDREMRLFSRNERKVQFPFNKILQNCCNLRHLDSSAFDRIRWNPSRLPKKLDLQRLTLTGWCNVKVSKVIIGRCANLKALDIGCMKATRRNSDYKIDLTLIKSDLDSLSLRGIHYSSENIRSFMSERGKRLRKFFFSSYVTSAPAICEAGLFTSIIQIIFESCFQLRELELRFVQQGAFGTLNSLQTLKHLEKIVIITEHRDLTEEMVGTILMNSPSLRSFVLITNHLHGIDLYKSCRRSCPQLKEFKSLPFTWDHAVEGNPSKS